MSDDQDTDGPPLLELFRSEAESQVRILTDGLLALDRNPHDLAPIDGLMRAAHSLKGAARIVNLEPIERLSHIMEDCFVAAQKGRLRLSGERIDRLLSGVDLIGQIAALSETSTAAWLEQNKLRIANLLVGMYEAADPARLTADRPAGFAAPAMPVSSSTLHIAPASALATVATVATAATPAAPANAVDQQHHAVQTPPETGATATVPRDEQVLKVGARNFDRLLSLASEARVAAHAMQPYMQSMQRFKKKQHDMFAAFDQLQHVLPAAGIDAATSEKAVLVRQKINPLKQALIEHLSDLEAYERRLLAVSQDMLDEVLMLRMRPFREGVQAFPRMVRDLARSLGKEVRLDIAGADTLVDRDILARIESPLNHMLRNAIDHGMETPEQRVAAGKPRAGTIRLEARHSAGVLDIQISDDGRGVDLEYIRRTVIERNMASERMASEMSASELLDFLLLPAFSLKQSANEISGRGVGLDVVHATIRALYGTVRLETERGGGFRAQITLPLSQSIMRVVVVEIDGEAYALPLNKIGRVLTLAASQIHTLEDKPFFTLGNEHVGLISAAQLLELNPTQPHADDVSVIVIDTGLRRYGLAVDAIRGEQNLVVHPLDAVFGKLRDVSAAGLLDDGSPVLVLDIEDLRTGIEKLADEGVLHALHALHAPGDADRAKAKRVLVVDDSLTVREMERKLLAARGYVVNVAVDGMDGWNAVRGNEYDLVIADVDMPRMDGIELVTLIRQDSRLRDLPVMIVSYKDRPEDRARGVQAGADYYLAKGSFHDETLLEAVVDLIGESGA